MGHIDLVLINPASRRRAYQSLGEELAAVEPPIWLGTMATFVRRQGRNVAVIDAEAEELSPAEVAQRVVDLRPRLAAVVAYGHQPSASTQTMPAARDVCAAIRASAATCKLLLCGGHPAALPERTLREEPVDFVAGGEGLYTLVDLLEALETASPSWGQVRDLWYRDARELRRGPAAPLLQDLDAKVPGVAWDLLPMERYRAHNWHCLGEESRQPYAAIYTTLGCPYRCTFCCIQAPFRSGEAALGRTGNSYRFWSPQRVVEELERLIRQYGVRHVKIADEMFVLNRRHVEAICELIEERRLDLNLWAYARVDTLRDGMLPKLKRAGFNWLALGIEAASSDVRQGVDKGFDQQDIYRACDQVRSEGIHVIGNYIFGLPDDDLATMQQTLDLALDLNCEFANFYCAMAYPGSALYEQALKNNWPLPANWSGYSQHAVDTLPLPTHHVSAAEVLRFRDEGFHTYYESPRYVEMLERTFGAAAVQHVRRMTAHRLKRNLYWDDGPRVRRPIGAQAECLTGGGSHAL
jgi:anaerobic magnesium-protoporphyrin IX monomethyl ester cyclase